MLAWCCNVDQQYCNVSMTCHDISMTGCNVSVACCQYYTARTYPVTRRHTPWAGVFRSQPESSICTECGRKLSYTGTWNLQSEQFTVVAELDFVVCPLTKCITVLSTLTKLTDISSRHPCTSGVRVMLLPLANSLHKTEEWVELNHKIIAVDFASRYCISCGNSTNIRLNLNTDTRRVGSQYNDPFTSETLHATQAACGWNHPKLYHMTRGQPHPLWVISLAERI